MRDCHDDMTDVEMITLHGQITIRLHQINPPYRITLPTLYSGPILQSSAPLHLRLSIRRNGRLMYTWNLVKT